MKSVEDIQKGLLAALPIRQSADTILVPTHCIFPGGQHVVVSIKQGHGGGFTVSDEAQAMAVINDASIDISPRQIHKAQELAKSYEASFSNGCFVISGVAVDCLPGAIVTLANLTQQWASELIYDHEVARGVELKVRVYDGLKRIFINNVDKEFEMIGQSNKPYKFDYRVKLPDDKFMLVDAINNHPIAISSAFQRNYDVKKSANDNYKQEGIIENQPTWKSEDLNLLGDVLDGIVNIESGLEPLRKYSAR